jgi:hypothetical protein
MEHENNPHSGPNVSVRGPFAESSLIEGLWGTLKTNIKRIYVTLTGHLSSFEHFVNEAMWRRYVDKLNEEDIEAFDAFLMTTFSHKLSIEAK